MAEISTIDPTVELAAQSNKIVNLVLSGGGAKGAGLYAVIAALQASGNWKEIERVAGSSAGALIATLVSLGVSTETLANIFANTNLMQLLGDKGFTIRSIPFNKDGKPLYELIATTIRNSVLEFLNNPESLNLDIKKINERFKERVKSLKKEIEKLDQKITEINDAIRNSGGKPSQKLLDSLSDAIKTRGDLNAHLQEIKSIVQANYSTVKDLFKNSKIFIDLLKKITDAKPVLFKDLAVLRCVNPEKFKDLYITAVEQKTGDLKLFNTDDDPNVDIAKVAQASSAIPGIFQPIEIDGKKYVDGGCRDNVPIDPLKNKNSTNANEVEKNTDEAALVETNTGDRTLAAVFSNNEDNTAYVAIHSEKANITGAAGFKKFIIDFLVRIFAFGGKSFLDSNEQTYQTLRKNSHDTVILDTGAVGTLDFDKAQELAEFLYLKAFCATATHLKNHDLNKKPIENLQYMELILDIFQNYDGLCQDKSGKKSWQDKTNEELSKLKLEAMLGICKPTELCTRASTDIINDLVTIASVKLKNGEIDNKFIDAAVKALNDPYITTTEMKKEVLKNLELPVPSDIVKFQFSSKDLISLLEKKPPISQKTLESMVPLKMDQAIGVR